MTTAMGGDERATAWAAQMRQVHDRLRAALAIVRDEPDTGGDLLLHCWGFCQALGGHHEGEDDVLFPAVAAAHPELDDVLAKLRQDHDIVSGLLADLARAVRAKASPDRIRSHLDGLGAIMESHFGFEERRLLPLLDGLALDAEPRAAFGPLADA